MSIATSPSRSCARRGTRPARRAMAAKAVRLAAARDFDVVLMDMRMPGMDGLEATRRIRALDGPRGQVPIVAVTANALDQHAEECRRAGMSEHLAKPFTQAELLAVVARAAGQRPQPASDAAPTIDADSRGAACRLHGRGCSEATARLTGAADRVAASPARGSGQLRLAGRTCRSGARAGWQRGNTWLHPACRGRSPLRERGGDRAVPPTRPRCGTRRRPRCRNCGAGGRSTRCCPY